MKIILILCLTFTLLTGCNTTNVPSPPQTPAPQNENSDTEIFEDVTNMIDKDFPTIPTFYIKNGENFKEINIVDFENKSIVDVTNNVISLSGLSLDVLSVERNNNGIVVNFGENNPSTLEPTMEIQILDSIAMTLYKNYKQEVIFRLNGKEYNSNFLFFGINENYPIEISKK